MNAVDVRSTMAMMALESCAETAAKAYSPMPGMPRSVSRKMEPLSRPTRANPIIVASGSRALRAMWRLTTGNSGSPLARAVRTKSWSSTSSTWARV